MVGNDGRPGWRWERNGQTIEGVDGPLLDKGAVSRGDRLAVIATVNGREIGAEVKIVNTPPKVESVMFTPGRLYRGADITATPKAVDVDGDEIRYSYRWSINGEAVPGNDSPVLKGEKLRKGYMVAVAVIAYDGTEEGATYTTRPAQVQNAPPAFVSTPPLSFEGHSYSYKATAQDPDGDTLVYSLLSAPRGMIIDGASGNIQWPITAESAGAHVVEIAVKDEEGLQATQKFSLSMTIPARSDQQPETEKK
ncbi:MAG: putative Ig domain-containing protein [Nitrospirota bacterium]|nr:putative Ig domain-containing protein [Nitrospirota bacterium]